VGTLLPFKNDRLLVRLMVRAAGPGDARTVMITGDHPAPAEFELAQIAVDPDTTAPQL
jgi:hypothetical protein